MLQLYNLVTEEREMIIKKFLLSGALAACVIAAGCGGSSGSSGSSSGGGSSSSGGSSGSSSGASGTTVSVAGPLDTVQTTLSGSVLSQLETATAGTPLQGVLVCTDDVVNQNTLDVVDSILNALQNPASAASAPPQIQALLLEMANNLGGLLNSLAGKGGCGSAAGSSSSSSGGGSVPVTNPLAGTPLAPLGDALLPILQKIQLQLAAGSSGGNGLADLASLVDQLNAAFQTGMAQVPASAFSQPVVGGVLTTLKVTVGNLAAVVDALSTSNSAAFQSATQALLDNLLVNVLTQIVPTSFIETQAGKPGSITGPIDTAAATFAATVATALTQGEQQLLAALNSSQLAPVVNPVLNTLLPAILGPITQALAGAGGSSSGGVTGTPLDALLGPLTTVLTGILGGTGTTCVFANTPLSALCKLLP